MARAQNSEDVWLVLGCARQAPANIAIINKGGLSVPMTGPVNVRLTFGEDGGFNLRADPIEETSLFLRSSNTGHLLRAIRDGTVLKVVYPDRAGSVKSYTWQLKHNDLAFAGMNAACHLDEP